jgi:UDPglucose 6-dehydrogenase
MVLQCPEARLFRHRRHLVGEPVKVSVIGCGYLGAVHAACMSRLGHDVVGIENDAAKVKFLAKGESPFFEPGLSELLHDGLISGRLRFSTDISTAAGAGCHFLCVGTPQRNGNDSADTSYLYAAFGQLLPQARPGDVIAGKSTVPVGTAAIEGWARRAAPGAVVAWNPEFLREGSAVRDTLEPERLVFGVPDGTAGGPAIDRLGEVYALPLAAGAPAVITDYATAELVKVAANAFLATKISFINAVAQVCAAAGGDVQHLARALGYDSRIGAMHLQPGLGFGGGCLPKDIRAFGTRARELGIDELPALLGEVDRINHGQRSRLVELAVDVCGGSVAGRRIAALGAAFKPNTDDIRDSPALDVCVRLRDLGADVVVTDPRAIENAARAYPHLQFAVTADEAAVGADLVLLLTDWPEFVALDPAALAQLVRTSRVIDARNALDRGTWLTAGWSFRTLTGCHRSEP